MVIFTRRFALELGQHGITVRVRLHELVDQQVLDRYRIVEICIGLEINGYLPAEF